MKKLFFSLAMLFAILTIATPSKAAIAGDKDCGEFSSKTAVMDFWYKNGYSKSYDPHDLDRDNDGLPCEVSAGEYSSYVKSKTTTTTTTTSNTGWKAINGKWYYYSNGVKKTGWLYTGGQWYFLDANGVMKTGWVKSGGKWYFLNSNGTMKTGWVASGGKWYYLNTDGSMATGWKLVSGSWYYLDANGVMKTGWIASGGKWYYLSSNGKMLTGWATISNKEYYFDAKGVMKTGWVNLEGTWFYFNANGSMKTGWFAYSGKWYYLDAEYGMFVGWNDIGENTYFFYENGVMAVDTEIDGIIIGSDGVAIFDEIETTIPDELKQNIDEVVARYNEYYSDEMTVEYDEEGWATFYKNGEYLGDATVGLVYGSDGTEYDFFAGIAMALDAPYGVDISDLVQEAWAAGEADNGEMRVVSDDIEGSIAFYWGEFY
ncbi:MULTISPECIES: excalibur calcium-binding domain-containing protein [unclassified Bacillus (in: firmicutes)]|uniref:excalibur calcium-binding domain-containing protein n=1 Tax=unclassified Bacillus (in: firmicutes) TaxID=185979 RepID=UPI0008E45FB6|nr:MULTISPECIES: excalibur calcium-binding domain-containing protein [unclassified Bacillus (in: firmicutes)]SFB04357.1 Glucan-binding domain-containing protein (YG repeat) [Bacillus sp. UNCCL13]SFQ88514.1 Glucan-binding domain-containing protein (YG repeat) [Bacillus sp. cl95]